MQFMLQKRRPDARNPQWRTVAHDGQPIVIEADTREAALRQHGVSGEVKNGMAVAKSGTQFRAVKVATMQKREAAQTQEAVA
jgi:hypothetical protein